MCLGNAGSLPPTKSICKDKSYKTSFSLNDQLLDFVVSMVSLNGKILDKPLHADWTIPEPLYVMLHAHYIVSYVEWLYET